jgi:HKD family nuclease
MRPFSARLVQNNAAQNHLAEIARLLPEAVALWIAVAFVSEKGVGLLLATIKNKAKKDVKIRIFVSTERAVSEPKALYLLWQHSIANPNFEVFCINKKDSAAFFHSKIYYFLYNETSSTMLGSANLTQGGLVENGETSLVFDEIIASRLDTQIVDLFLGLRQISRAVDGETVAAYSDFFAETQGLTVDFEMTDERKTAIFNQYFKNKTFENPKLRLLKQSLIHWLATENAPIPNDIAAYFSWLQPKHRNIVRFIQHHQAVAAATLWRAVCHENTQQNTKQNALISYEEMSALLHLYQPRRFVPISEALFLFLRYECGLQTGSLRNITPENYAACCQSFSTLRKAWRLKTNGEIVAGFSLP